MTKCRKIYVPLLSVFTLIMSCQEGGSTGKNSPSDSMVRLCPIEAKWAMNAGAYFENDAVDGNLLIKPWNGHSHTFSELEKFSWTKDDFAAAAKLSQHVDLQAKFIRFADNDIAVFLNNEKLCSKTITFLKSYLGKKEQQAFDRKLKGS